jgi:hypothetical protein
LIPHNPFVYLRLTLLKTFESEFNIEFMSFLTHCWYQLQIADVFRLVIHPIGM